MSTLCGRRLHRATSGAAATCAMAMGTYTPHREAHNRYARPAAQRKLTSSHSDTPSAHLSHFTPRAQRPLNTKHLHLRSVRAHSASPTMGWGGLSFRAEAWTGRSDHQCRGGIVACMVR